MGLEQLFYASVKKNPEKTAVVFQDNRASYSQMLAGVNAYAEYLEGHSQPGDSILVIAHNSIQQLQLLLACFAAGRVACPINWRMSERDLARVLLNTRFGFCFYDEPCEALFQGAVEQSARELPAMEISAVPPAEDPGRLRPEQPEDSFALQFFTSGSTGTPKRVLHTHGSMARYAQAYSRTSNWSADDVYETQSNLFHMSGFSCLISLFVGGTLVLMDRFREEVFFETMERERCTRISLVPTLISKCLSSGAFQKYDFSRVKKIVYGGSPLPLAQVRRTLAECACSLEQAYGTTETCNISVLSGEDHAKAVRGELDSVILESAGKPIPGVEILLVDEDGKPVTEGTGEVAVRSPYLLSKVEGDAMSNFLEGGYYRTGDIGRIDSQGYLYLIDRKNDMIVSGGENIFPREVENCISHLVNDVSMTAVIGVPDSYWGEKVVAFVVRHPGSQISGQEIIDFCRSHIASYKKPREVIFLDHIPLNTNGKISRKIMKKIYARDYAGESSTSGASSACKQ